MPGDPTTRFTDRVENYVRYRPGYPREIVEYLASELACRPPGPLLDVGSGTGLLTRPLLEAGYAVTGVEPNKAMRDAGARHLADCPGFTSLDGTAEQMPVNDRSAGAILAAQAFHWFKPAAARAEFARVLRPGGWVVLLWNNRETDSTPFLRGYEALLRTYCPDYADIQATHADEEEIAAFFAPEPMRLARFPNHQDLDLPAIRGRLLSSSYVPSAGPDHEAILRDLDTLFAATSSHGRVQVRYQTCLFSARFP